MSYIPKRRDFKGVKLDLAWSERAFCMGLAVGCVFGAVSMVVILGTLLRGHIHIY